MVSASLPVYSENHPLEIPSWLEESEIDGLLLVGIFADGALRQLLERCACPLVLINASVSGSGECSAVVPDNALGSYRATEYLFNKGHRQIGFAGGHEQAYSGFRERRGGDLQALKDYDICPPYFADCSMNPPEVASAVLNLIMQHRQITGLVCVNDDVAISAIYASMKAGIRVPEDISIIGFDDISLAGSMVPALTTMRVNKPGMGRLAVQLLLNQMSQPERVCITSVFRPYLVERSSVMAI